MGYKDLQPWQQEAYDKATQKGAPGGTGLGSKVRETILDIFNKKTSHNGNVNDND